MCSWHAPLTRVFGTSLFGSWWSVSSRTMLLIQAMTTQSRVIVLSSVRSVSNPHKSHILWYLEIVMATLFIARVCSLLARHLRSRLSFTTRKYTNLFIEKKYTVLYFESQKKNFWRRCVGVNRSTKTFRMLRIFLVHANGLNCGSSDPFDKDFKSIKRAKYDVFFLTLL